MDIQSSSKINENQMLDWTLVTTMHVLVLCIYFLLFVKNAPYVCTGETGDHSNETFDFETENGTVINSSLVPSDDEIGNPGDIEERTTSCLWFRDRRCLSVRTYHTCHHIQTLWKNAKPLVALVHGYTENCLTSQICTTVRDAFLARFDYNILTVDWSILARPPNYANAVRNAVGVGHVLARLMQRIVNNCRLVVAKDVQIIGFSLGAQVAGHTGSRYQVLSRSKLGRLTGLDPAGPLYMGRPPSIRLDPSDAEYVDVIHTNGCGTTLLCVGIGQPCGHVDFYPNGGVTQSGCFTKSCSHHRAVAYFRESIRIRGSFRSCCYRTPQQRPAADCSGGNYDNYMGQPTKARGFCYLTTNPSPPYSNSNGRIGSGSYSSLKRTSSLAWIPSMVMPVVAYISAALPPVWVH